MTNLRNYTCSFRRTIYIAIHHFGAQPHPQYIHESPPTDESRQRDVEAKREAKRVVRRAKNEEWIDLGRELEADAQGGQKWFWLKVRYLGGRGREEVFRRVKDEDGMIVGEEELVIDRWKRYFTGLYSCRDKRGCGEQ